MIHEAKTDRAEKSTEKSTIIIEDLSGHCSVVDKTSKYKISKISET